MQCTASALFVLLSAGSAEHTSGYHQEHKRSTGAKRRKGNNCCTLRPSLHFTILKRAMGRLEDLVISNSTLETLPVEPDEGRSRTPHQVRGYVFSHCAPTPLRQPTLVAASQSALDLLGLDASEVG